MTSERELISQLQCHVPTFRKKKKINVLFGVFPNQTKSDLDEVLRFCRENRKGYRDNST